MLNMDVLHQFSEEVDDIREVLDQFLETTDSDILLLEQAVEERDIGLVAELAHRIKGASQAIGATDLTGTISALEADARTHEDHSFEILYSELCETYRELSDQIRQF